LKRSTTTATHKKAVILRIDGTRVQAYLNPSALGASETVEILTTDGEYLTLEMSKIKSIHFVREFTNHQPAERKTFLSRPKLEGLWVRCLFRDKDSIEGIVANNLVEIANHGLRLTPPDLHGNTLWIFIPRTALSEVKVLGVVGISRRQPAAAASSSQPKLFDE